MFLILITSSIKHGAVVIVNRIKVSYEKEAGKIRQANKGAG